MASDDSVEAVVGRALHALQAAEVPYMLVGSFASAFHGSPRTTQDIDVVIAPTLGSLQKLHRVRAFGPLHPKPRVELKRDDARRSSAPRIAVWLWASSVLALREGPIWVQGLRSTSSTSFLSSATAFAGSFGASEPTTKETNDHAQTLRLLRGPPWCGGRRHQCQTRITIRIDDDVLKWFRQQVDEAGGGSYQTMINEALRSYMAGKQELLEVVLRRLIKEELRKAKPKKTTKSRKAAQR